MFKSIVNWVNSNALKIIGVLIVIGACYTVFNLIDVSRKPAEIVVKEGSIQNRLVWSASGNCFFVRPMAGETVYLIPVKDCDKK